MALENARLFEEPKDLRSENVLRLIFQLKFGLRRIFLPSSKQRSESLEAPESSESSISLSLAEGLGETDNSNDEQVTYEPRNHSSNFPRIIELGPNDCSGI